ncbi:1,6-anhydro-N-acetylmuramyl-L-alanine amidase AmpD [Halopseudomonas nanhaiensis]|uniref:1,6-anhydro-N-acetylmuramyl-L-alanine amidase AmpD n=1 Tax=Halopseudomonas nanhaiensis TaxID=2830842 RepID=UPI001CBB3750|nr:1,6-anhydro-N-acetylmuramyl-L-alanine amidase AmpD [Halopseudomonas nanhaiensis]UAW97630.1 1,6-anhydro-N-acetylmuramyl-L-alanine amidase AmpD [Halopseudomonas nanhaiensis]
MMQVADDGWVEGVLRCPSAHFNERPVGETVSLLVIHNISLPPGQFGGGHVQEFFTGHLDPDVHPYFAGIVALRVSAHFLIERTGSLTQFVSCLDRAWHAGASHHGGRPDCNDFSVGVELEGTDDTPFTDEQYATLTRLSDALMRRFPEITPYRVTGHEHIARGRKTDPGVCFDWRRYLCSLPRPHNETGR